MADKTQNPNGDGKSGDDNVNLETFLGDGQTNNGSSSDNQNGNQNGNQQGNNDQNNQGQQNQNQQDDQQQNQNIIDIDVNNLALDEASGNVVDEKTGKIIIPKDKVKLDDKGNLILPDDIKIDDSVKTGQVENDKTAIKALQETLGISPVDENGKKKKYTDDATGLINYTTDVVNTAKQSAVQDFLKANPVIQSFINHLQGGGNQNDFDSKIRYSTVQYDAANEKLNLDLIKADLSRKGVDKDSIEDMLTLIKTNGTWAAKGKTAYDSLVNNEKTLRDADEKAAKAAWEKEQKEIAKYWKNAEDLVLTKGTIDNVTIPVDDRETFFQYISKPIDNEGNSQFDLDYYEASQEKRMLLQYLVYRKMDFSTLIEQKARTLAVKKLSESKGTNKTINLKRIEIQRSNQEVPTLDQLL
ncbi:MAG: hypothetical protein JST04_01045 [Bdellovibrionales bacterium]|nr:hypothetical protein [Bdellovibrionales bacterium]